MRLLDVKLKKESVGAAGAHCKKSAVAICPCCKVLRFSLLGTAVAQINPHLNDLPSL
jgi:hypothetical protein